MKQLDAVVYGIVGPFSVAYIIPKFFSDLQMKLNIQFQEIVIFNYAGIFFMNFWALIAIWSTIVMQITNSFDLVFNLDPFCSDIHSPS